MNLLELILNSLIIITLTLSTLITCYQSFVDIPVRYQSLSNWCIYGGTVFSTIILGIKWFQFGHIPCSNLYESSLVLSWIILVLSIITPQISSTLLVIIPTSLLLKIFAMFVLPQSITISTPLVPALQSNWLMMHVSMMISSYAFLIIGAIIALMWLVVNSTILNLSHTESICFFTRQAEILNKLDYWSYRLISIGFPILTIGIISGAVWANEVWGNYWSWDPKETWAFLTWMIFAIYLHTRLNSTSYNTEQSALTATSGLGIVWVCYLGVNLLGQGLHSYGWFQ